jgi:hypothetical protein
MVTCYVVYFNQIVDLKVFLAKGRGFYLACNLDYFAGILTALGQQWQSEDLVFYITRDLEQLPSYGPEVVAIVVGDEWCRWPRYSQRVRAVFKCHGTRPTLGFRWDDRPSYLNLLSAAQFLTIQRRRLPSTWARRGQQLQAQLTGNAWRPTVFPIPLGYYNQQNLPIKPFWQRSQDLYYSGSVVNDPCARWSPKAILGTPKSRSRQLMATALQQFQQHHPKYAISQDDQIPSFNHNPHDASVPHNQPQTGLSYSERMMDMRICLVPRGSSIETFRFFEGLRYGCVLVTEQLPDYWFYRGAPIRQVSHWGQLESVLLDLLRHPQQLELLHYKSLAWWNLVCSEAAIAGHMARQLGLEPTSALPFVPAVESFPRASLTALA